MKADRIASRAISILNMRMSGVGGTKMIMARAGIAEESSSGPRCKNAENTPT
jgi:hypothetical protein